jgi:hypothetical protein
MRIEKKNKGFYEKAKLETQSKRRKENKIYKFDFYKKKKTINISAYYGYCLFALLIIYFLINLY